MKFGLYKVVGFEPLQEVCINVCADKQILLDFCKKKGYNIEGGWAEYSIRKFK